MITKKLLYRCPFLLIVTALIVATAGISCSNSHKHERIISNAESIVYENPDSALALLAAVDPAELTQDSVKAEYYYVLASAHDAQNHIALSDSMIIFSNDYYRGKDLKRSIKSATLLASYKFRIGERGTALRMLDSLSSLDNVPDSLLIDPLRTMVNLGTYYRSNESHIRRLMAIDKDKKWLSHYKYLLYFDFLFSGKNDSALVVLNEFIDMTAKDVEKERKFTYEYEKIGVLEELGRYAESMNMADSLMNEPMGSSIKHYFYLWKSLAMLNMRDHTAATRELAKADSFATAIPEDERGYFNSFAYVIRTVLDYQRTGKVSLIPMARKTIVKGIIYSTPNICDRRQPSGLSKLKIKDSPSKQRVIGRDLF